VEAVEGPEEEDEGLERREGDGQDEGREDAVPHAPELVGKGLEAVVEVGALDVQLLQLHLRGVLREDLPKRIPVLDLLFFID
jgi:hypothetical protein